MVFAALLAVTCLRRALNRLHYMGIACCLVHTLSMALVQTKHMLPGLLAVQPVRQLGSHLGSCAA